MRVLQVLGGAVLYLLAAVVGLVGVVLSVTVVLLPLGIPLLILSGMLFRRAIALMLPRRVSHPVEEAGKKVRRKTRRLRKGKDLPGVSRHRKKRAERKIRGVTKRLHLSS